MKFEENLVITDQKLTQNSEKKLSLPRKGFHFYQRVLMESWSKVM
jgi:hypothetical protein